ncbi:hypothetical protein DFQ28_007819 [Apophysomyces sp. BC1034]|nr:hypothetical protein DFQ28_007819 [Apophysomyces sp. BC1034]
MADPIGIRQNNPGNIRYGAGFDEEQEGEKGFGAYPTPTAGGKALIKNLSTYYTKHGLNTVRGIVSRWAPDNENNTAAYITAVSGQMGVGPDDALNMTDSGTIRKLATAISKQEGNGAVYNGDFWSALMHDDPTLAAYVASEKFPPFMKKQARRAAYHANPNGPGEPAMNINDMSAIDRIFTGAGEVEQAAVEQSGRELAALARWANFGEGFLDGLGYESATGAIFDMMQRGEPDPDFRIDEERFKQMGKAGVLRSKELSDYVRGAVNAEDFERRLDKAVERADFLQRASNTMGLQSFGVHAGQFIGGMLDPVAVVATLGAGWAANTVRVAAGMAATRAMGAAGGAAGNIAAAKFVRSAYNQEFSWGEFAVQGLLGAGLGALGRVNRPARGHVPETGQPVPAPVADPVLRPIAAAVQDSIQSTLDLAYERGRTAAPDPWVVAYGRNGLSTELHDVPAAPAIGRVLSEERHVLAPADTSARMGYTPAATLADTRYRKLHEQGVIMELRTASDLDAVSPHHAKYSEAIPKDAKAFYSPHDDRVYMFRDRLTTEEAKDPTGLVMHEVGVHYGLERMVGTENFTKLLKAIDESTDPRVIEAKARVPKDTPERIKLEEALGYLAEKHPKLPAMNRIVSTIRNWLRDNIPAFRRMALTPDDVLQYVRGAAKGTGRRGTASSDGQLGIINRYSRGDSVLYPSNATQVRLRMSKVASDIADRAAKWVEDATPETKLQRERLKQWYDVQRIKSGADNIQKAIDSPGLIVQRDPSKVARYLGAHLFEDASGYGKRESTVSMDYERAQLGYKHTSIPALQENLVKGLTPAEKAQRMMGAGQAAEDRLHRQIAEERLAHRAALQAGTPYVSSAPEHIKAMAKTLDDLCDKVTADGKLAGYPYAEAVRGSGFVGFMPYAWRWDRIQLAYETDAPRFAALHENLTQQYTEKIVEPTITDLLKKNPEATPGEIRNLRDRMSEKVGHMVDTKLRILMKDPQARINHFDQQFEIIAGDLLKENFDGQVINSDLLRQFKEQLADIRTDRSRTELDLLRKVNGISLLDFIDYHGERMATQIAHHFAGRNALARKGFRDQADAMAAIEAAQVDGASADALQALDFGFRSFGLGHLNNRERQALALIRNATYMAIGGKLGLSAAADLASVATAIGVSGAVRTIGTARMKDSAFLKQMAVDAPGLLGQDYRIHSMTPDLSATGRTMIGEGSTLYRASQQGVQLTSWLNGMNFINRALHRGFLPVFAEKLLRAINGKDGGITPRRLGDLGIDPDMVTRIKGQLDRYDAGRERGGRINWDQWDDQVAADKLIEAMHRGTWQVFQRALVGEAPMWLSESVAGSLFGQFRRYGIVAMEKQLVRNLAIGDMNTALAFVLGTAWAGMLYYARLQLNSLGKSEAQKQKYIEENTKGFRLAAGVLTLMNASGMLPDAMNFAELIFGGTMRNPVGSSAAAIDYGMGVGKALNSAGSLATGQSENRGRDAKNTLRIAPFANTIIGTYLTNSLTAP